MPILLRALLSSLILLAGAVPAAARSVTQPAVPGHDHLAYVFDGKLYVGYPGTVHVVPGPGNAYEPAFSPDGRWLAFLRQRWQRYDVSSQLWLARSDGSDARAVTPMGGTGAGDFQWSLTADVLAVQPVNGKGEPLPLQLIPAQGPAHSVPDGLQGSFLWLTSIMPRRAAQSDGQVGRTGTEARPYGEQGPSDGHTLAIAATSRTGYTRLALVNGATVRWYTIPGIGRYDPIILAAWWPAAGSIVYWLDRGGCFSCIADGTPLYAFDLRAGKTRQLGVGLIYRDWVTVAGTHLLALTGRDRSAFFGKHLRLCQAHGPCRSLARQPGQFPLDPTYAPNGSAMAFVVAPAWRTDGFQSDTRYWSWLDAHVLWIARPDGSGARPLDGVPNGAQDPQWTRDGRGIVFVKDGALWLDPHAGAANAHAIARLVPAHFVPDVLRNPAFQGWYYGHMDWDDLFAWY